MFSVLMPGPDSVQVRMCFEGYHKPLPITQTEERCQHKYTTADEKRTGQWFQF